MKKTARELIRLARSEGWSKVRVENGQPHARLIGEVNGKSVELVVTLTKSFANARYAQQTKLNIRRATEA